MFFLEVRAISNYKKQYQKAKNDRALHLQEKTELEAQIAQLEKKKESVDEILNQDEKTIISKGLLYYDQEKRETILNDAEKLCYSKERITRIRRDADDENWNTDTVGLEMMQEFDAMEQYVGNNTSWWEKSPLSKFGSWLNQKGKDS